MKRMLAAAAAIIAVVLLAASPVGAASKPPPRSYAEEAAWYLKGEGDAILNGQGAKIVSLTCQAKAGANVVCAIRITGYAPYPVCGHGSFEVKGYSVDGQFSAPKRCRTKPAV